jgi:hypothetical protein
LRRRRRRGDHAPLIGGAEGIGIHRRRNPMMIRSLMGPTLASTFHGEAALGH